ncbi:unnamed protein product [Sphacelaria rigidula]
MPPSPSLVPGVAIFSRLVKMITYVGGTVLPGRPRKSRVSFSLGYRMEMGVIYKSGDGGLDCIKTKGLPQKNDKLARHMRDFFCLERSFGDWGQDTRRYSAVA